MDSSTLVAEEIDAGAKFLSEFQKYRPVKIAFWLKIADERPWWLYVGSDQITGDNFDVAYGEVVEITHQRRDPWFNPLCVKLISADDPLAKAALEAQGRYPGRPAVRLRDQVFGGLYADAVYIYPSPVPVPAH
jgi:hypothetical protein